MGVLVQAVDGKFYIEPVVFDELCFLKFDEDDGPSVMIKMFAGTTQASAHRRLRAFLREMGIAFCDLGDAGLVGNTLFPPDWKTWHKSLSMRIEILRPIPVPGEHKGCVDMPGTGCSLYIWESEFSRADVESLWSERMNLWLLEFLTGKALIRADLGKYREFGQTEVLRQYPGFLDSGTGMVVLKREKGVIRL